MDTDGRPLLVIFDWDGVVTKVDGLWENTKLAARWCGLPLGPVAHEEHNGKYASVRDFIYGSWPGISTAKARQFRFAFGFLELVRPHVPVPGAVETIRKLREEGVFLALCTSRDPFTLRTHLAHAGVDPRWFVKVVTGFHRPTKPHPSALGPIWQKIPICPKHAVLVGDTPTDWETARGAGVPFIGVLSGLTSREGFKESGVPEGRLAETLSDAFHRFLG